jgi:ATP-dependent Lhr-like helicase
MKFVAQRFGVLPRGAYLSEADLEDLCQRFEGTPVYEETINEAQARKVDLESFRKVLDGVRTGTVTIKTVLVSEPSPISFRMLNHFAAVPEMKAPETVKAQSVVRLQERTEASRVELFCLQCGDWGEEVRIRDIPEKPICPKCGSLLIAAFDRPNPFAKNAVVKRIHREKLNADEQKILTETRRNADVVLSYGKRGIMALSIHGIGPQTASRVLARMHMSDEDMFRDLLEAKIHYIETRKYWDDDRKPIHFS